MIVSVGRLAAPKDPLALVAALARLPAGAFRAVLVGGGPKHAAVAAAIRGAGLDGVVDLVGDRDDVPAALAAADLFVLASRSEGLPMSVLEAMAAGLPVVASAVGGVAEAVADGETGLLVAPGDVDALAGAIERLLADGTLRRAMGSAGRARAAEHFALGRFRAEHVGALRARVGGGAEAQAAVDRAQRRRRVVTAAHLGPEVEQAGRARRPGRGAGPADRSRGR